MFHLITFHLNNHEFRLTTFYKVTSWQCLGNLSWFHKAAVWIHKHHRLGDLKQQMSIVSPWWRWEMPVGPCPLIASRGVDFIFISVFWKFPGIPWHRAANSSLRPLLNVVIFPLCVFIRYSYPSNFNPLFVDLHFSNGRVIWMRNIPHRLVCLSTWSPVWGTVLGGPATFRALL